MFRVVLQQPLYKDSAKREFGKMFFREIQLPFPPYVGLTVRGEKWDSWPIVSVRWDLGDQYFICTLEEPVPRDAPGVAYEELFEYLENEEGWTPAHRWKRHET